jgi:signal transduction histidine kinase
VKGKPAQSVISWLFVGAMFVLCGILGALQYRWIGEVSVAERERLQQRLQADLNRIGLDFNAELAAACRALVPPAPAPGTTLSASSLEERYAAWKKNSRHTQFFRTIAVAIPHDAQLELDSIDFASSAAHQIAWPSDWNTLQSRLEARLSAGGFRQPPGYHNESDAHLFEIPIFAPRSRGLREGPFGRIESGWLILDLNLQYVRETVLPELVQRHIGNAGGGLDYQVVVLTRSNPPAVVFETAANTVKEIAGSADAAVGLFDIQMDQIFPHPEPPGMRGPGPSSNFRVGPDMGRWQMLVRNRAGSLEAVVASTRRRSLAVTGAVLLLLIATAGAWLRFTRRAQRLARLQLDFVAGISHELRTPLSVIYGAAYNLRGAVAQNPAQVERYGVLLQQESGRLRDLVEQVLRFSSAEAGNAIREREPISIHDLIDQTMDSSKSVIQGAQCVVEKKIDAELPIVLGDPLALKHALQNLVANAAKYGQAGNNGSNWIGVAASAANTDAVEIRVTDHGPGIPSDEKEHVFDAFFRGRRAIQDQIHGTGLGLNLVKKIIEAHGGSIRVESEPMKQTEFIVRLPATTTAGAKE